MFSADPTLMKVLDQEFRQLVEDRACLRNSIFKLTSDDQVHLPLNIGRIIANAKQ